MPTKKTTFNFLQHTIDLMSSDPTAALRSRVSVELKIGLEATFRRNMRKRPDGLAI